MNLNLIINRFYKKEKKINHLQEIKRSKDPDSEMTKMLALADREFKITTKEMLTDLEALKGQRTLTDGEFH